MVKRIIYPPIWLVFGLGAIFAFNTWLPGARFTSAPAQALGGVLIIAGLVLLVVANGLFMRAGTDAIPFRNVTALVTGGVYRVTRNPMYLGMAALLFGTAITVGASTALLVPPLFMLIVEWRFIRPEEVLLHQLFGEEYRAYCARVRRWL